MATTVAQAFQRLLREVPDLGEYYPTVTSLTATTLVLDDLQNGNLGTTAYENWIAERADSTAAADRARFVTTYAGATGTLTHDGVNYSDTTATSEVLRLWKRDYIRPDTHLIRLFQDSCKLCRFRGRVRLFHGPASADMQGPSATVDSDWTETNATD